MERSVCMRNRLIKAAAPAYKNVIMTHLINDKGNLLDKVTEKIQHLDDLGEWDSWGSAGNQDTQDNPKNSANRISWEKKIFAALLTDGMSHYKIDGFPTHELWRICKQRGLNKPTKPRKHGIVKQKIREQLSLRHLLWRLKRTSHLLVECRNGMLFLHWN